MLLQSLVGALMQHGDWNAAAFTMRLWDRVRGLMLPMLANVGAQAMYRAFERRKWNAALQKNPQGPLGPEAKAAGERVVKIYRRQLAVPMRGNDRTLEAMKRFVAMVASKCPGTSETKQEWDEMQGAEKLHEKVCPPPPLSLHYA